MHELSLAQALTEQLVEAARKENALRVERVIVVIGALAGVERDAFEFVFPFAVENTVAEGAELVIEEVPATAVCNRCGGEFSPDLACLACGKCGSDDVALTGGREFLIRSVDLEIP